MDGDERREGKCTTRRFEGYVNVYNIFIFCVFIKVTGLGLGLIYTLIKYKILLLY